MDPSREIKLHMMNFIEQLLKVRHFMSSSLQKFCSFQKTKMGDKTKEMTKKRLFEEIAELKYKLKETNDFFRGKIIKLETTLH